MASVRRVAALLCPAFISITLMLGAQQPTGTIAGRVTYAATKAVAGATVRVLGTRWSARARDDASFRIENVAPGSYRVLTSIIGFLPDTATTATARRRRVATIISSATRRSMRPSFTT